MYTGISAACRDLRYGADELFDSQDLYDIKVISTLGLTDEDVQVLQSVDGVKHAEGTYSETVHTQANGKQQEARITVLRENGLSQPALLEGKLPVNKHEIAVTENYCKDTGKKIGDTLVLEPESGKKSPLGRMPMKKQRKNLTLNWKRKNHRGLLFLRIRLLLLYWDPTDLIADEGAAAYRSSESIDYFFFVTEDAVDSDIYTAVELTVSGAEN